jgi:WXG100 family type VII secretion target
MQFTTQPEDIQAAATSCQTTADLIAQQLATLRTYVEGLQAIYQGIAATTFAVLMQDYQVYAAMLYNALHDIGQGLTGNYVNYTDTEQANINSLTQINGQFPGIGQTPDLVNQGATLPSAHI